MDLLWGWLRGLGRSVSTKVWEGRGASGIVGARKGVTGKRWEGIGILGEESVKGDKGRYVLRGKGWIWVAG
jgi:hypothetical protein